MPTSEELQIKLRELGHELDARAAKFSRVEAYRSGRAPLPPAIVQAKVTRAYRMLMSVASTNYAQLIVRAAASRMEVGSLRTGDDELDDQIWQIWQANRLDAESRRAHDSILTHGRAHTIVRPSERGPEIILEDAKTCVVEYEEGSRHNRLVAMRRWIDNDYYLHATLYYPDATYRFITERKYESHLDYQTEAGIETIKWLPIGEPLPNPFGVVPVSEIAINSRLSSGKFGTAAGDFESAIGLLDRINLLEFLRLVIAFTAGFPIRVVVGDKILRDDNGKPIEPFKLAADAIAQFEDPNVRVTELAGADLKGFGDAIDHDIETLAGITQTPAYYLRSVPIQNVSADAIRASDAPLNARVEDHKPFIAEGWEETCRVAALMGGLGEVSQGAEIQWVNRESRSLAERADAAVKLSSILPWQALAEYVLDASQEEIARWEQQRAAGDLNSILAQLPEIPDPVDG
jgi:hypothetical protein